MYTGDVVFLRSCKLIQGSRAREGNERRPAVPEVKGARVGPLEVPVAVSFVACNEERCLPPQTVKVTAHVKVVPNADRRLAAAE